MASILQTVYNRLSNEELPHLKKVDFIWIVRDPSQVAWFVDLLADIEMKQSRPDIRKVIESKIYITRALADTDMCAVALRAAMKLYYKKTEQEIVYGLTSELVYSRPDFTKVFEQIDQNKQGNVSVFYCGHPKVGDVVKKKCVQYQYGFHREVF